MNYGSSHSGQHTRLLGYIFLIAAPTMLAVFPISFLAANNLDAGTPVTEVLVPTSLGVLGVLVFSVAASFIFRSVNIAATIATILVLTIFGYGHFVSIVDGWSISGIVLGRQIIVLPIVTLLTAIAIYFAVGSDRNFGKIAFIIVVGATILTLLNWSRILHDHYTELESSESRANSPQQTTSNMPDIYWFIFDSYARADVLKEIYNFDNRDFTDALQRRGFIIGSEARANYVVTVLSLPASLAMNQLADMTAGERDRATRGRSTRNWRLPASNLGRLANEQGYALRSFTSENRDSIFLTDFMITLMDTTIFRIFPLQQFWFKNRAAFFQPNLNKVERVPSDPLPTFTMSYNLPPHPPFAFNADGSIQENADYAFEGREWLNKDGYIAQLQFINQRIISLVDTLINESDNMPIIVLQSDTGPASQSDPTRSIFDPPNPDLLFERIGILNAILVPEYCRTKHIASVSAVNTFRAIFDECLGTDLGLVSDVTYWGKDRFIQVAP